MRPRVYVETSVISYLKYIATWKFVHLVGASAKMRLRQAIVDIGWKPPIVATPEELLEEFS